MHTHYLHRIYLHFFVFRCLLQAAQDNTMRQASNLRISSGVMRNLFVNKMETLYCFFDIRTLFQTLNNFAAINFLFLLTLLKDFYHHYKLLFQRPLMFIFLPVH